MRSDRVVAVGCPMRIHCSGLHHCCFPLKTQTWWISVNTEPGVKSVRGGAAQGKAVNYKGTRAGKKKNLYKTFMLKDSCVFIIKEDKRNVCDVSY